METISKKLADNKLELAVLNWMNERAEDYEDTGVKGVFEDLQQGGCQSGMVSELIYYTDTVKFYEKHKSDINTLLTSLLEETGSSVSELFGDKWDKTDPLAADHMNQNLLAWFGFEESANRVYSKFENS